MYQTCMFCKKPLGANEVLEEFPVGRRLAFDATKGRLWVVCRKCQRWNLTPLEERWEAVAQPAGRGRGDGRLRALVGASGLVSLPFAVLSAVGLVTYPVLAWEYLRPVAKVRVDGSVDGGPAAPDQVARFSRYDLRSIRLLPDDDEPGLRVEVHKGMRKAWFLGEHARRVAATLVPHLNGWGGSRLSVQRAVHEIESEGHPDRFVAQVAKLGHRDWRGRSGYIRSLPDTTRLALEMALHEEQERRALEGELQILEQAWKEAEEIAAIADNLLLPTGTDAFFDRHGEDG